MEVLVMFMFIKLNGTQPLLILIAPVILLLCHQNVCCEKSLLEVSFELFSSHALNWGPGLIRFNWVQLGPHSLDAGPRAEVFEIMASWL